MFHKHLDLTHSVWRPIIIEFFVLKNYYTKFNVNAYVKIEILLKGLVAGIYFSHNIPIFVHHIDRPSNVIILFITDLNSLLCLLEMDQSTFLNFTPLH